jgi:hypothetical protein
MIDVGIIASRVVGRQAEGRKGGQGDEGVHRERGPPDPSHPLRQDGDAQEEEHRKAEEEGQDPEGQEKAALARVGGH